MKIACLSHLASASAPTGAEQSLALLARGLRQRGHEVAVLTTGPWVLAEDLREAGVTVSSVPLRMAWLVQYRGQPWWRQALRALRFAVPDRGAARLGRHLAASRPDVVHVNCLPHVRGAQVARGLGLPVVWHVREMLPPGVRRRWFAGRLWRDATRIVAVSEAVGEWVREEGLGDRLTVVHNGVDPPEKMPQAAAARAAFGLPGGVPVIGLFSQLVAHKGALEFVAAAHRMAAAGEAWFLIAGHGPEAFVRRVRAAIADGPAAGRIRLLPPQPEIWPLLAAVDAVAVTTLWPDPLPRVVMEAMAAGRPVAGFGGGGVPEMVVEGVTGLLCEPGDVAGLAAAFESLATDEEGRRRMGAAGARRARELFGVERHLDRMEAALGAAATATSHG